MKEIKVKLKFHENDSYVEVWEVVSNEHKKEYFARLTWGGGEWSFVSDPFGYCELDHSCPDDYIFEVCDANGVGLFKSSNGDETRSFPCLRELSNIEWVKFVKGKQIKVENKEANFWAMAINGIVKSTYGQWLLTFKDPDLYGKEAEDYDENWIYFRTEEVNRENLKAFKYVGTEHHITKIHMRHTICGVEWDEYYSGQEFMGTCFDESNIGTMYSKAEAIDKVTNALVVGYYEAERLIGRDFSRKHIEAIIKQ